MASQIPVTPVRKVYSNSPANMTMRVTPVQKELIVSFMEAHPNLVNGKIGRNLTNGEHTGLWRELTDILNASGDNVTKNPEKWRKTWSDMKRDLKEKVTRIREQQMQPPMSGLEERLTPLQEKLLALLNKLEEAPEDGTAPPGTDVLGSETDASKSSCAEDRLINDINNTKEYSDIHIDAKELMAGELFADAIKQEPTDIVSEGIYSQQYLLANLQEQARPSPPPAKKIKIIPSAEVTVTSTQVQAGTGVLENPCPKHNGYKTLSENQAATASALSRIADAAERRVVIEERKAAAMERFVELFFKQQQKNS